MRFGFFVIFSLVTFHSRSTNQFKVLHLPWLVPSIGFTFTSSTRLSNQFIHFIDRFFPFNIFFKHFSGIPVSFNPLRTDVLCSKLYPVLPFPSLSLFLSFTTHRFPFYLLTQFSPKTLYSHEIFRSKLVTRGGVFLTHDIIYDFGASSSQGIIPRDTIKALAANLDGLELLQRPTFRQPKIDSIDGIDVFSACDFAHTAIFLSKRQYSSRNVNKTPDPSERLWSFDRICLTRSSTISSSISSGLFNVDVPNNLDLKQIVRFRSNVRIQEENAVFFSPCDNQEVDMLAIVDRKWK